MFVCVCVCVLFTFMNGTAATVRRCVSFCAGSPSNPGYLAEPARDTDNIEILQGTNLTVECVADTFNPSVQYTWTHPSRTGVGQSEYFSFVIRTYMVLFVIMSICVLNACCDMLVRV